MGSSFPASILIRSVTPQSRVTRKYGTGTMGDRPKNSSTYYLNDYGSIRICPCPIRH